MTSPAPEKTAPTLPGGLVLDGGLALARTRTAQETLGQRLARLRKEKGITQIELAARLGVSQPLISEWERDALRLNSETILALVEILEVSADELLGLEKSKTGNGAAPARRFTRRLQAITKLPKRDQEALLRTLDAFLGKVG